MCEVKPCASTRKTTYCFQTITVKSIVIVNVECRCVVIIRDVIRFLRT